MHRYTAGPALHADEDCTDTAAVRFDDVSVRIYPVYGLGCLLRYLPAVLIHLPRNAEVGALAVSRQAC